MLSIDHPRDLVDHVGREIGVSAWVLIDQGIIDRFAEVTGDDQWIHVDVARARKEMPGGSTIAHGFLTLCLMPKLNYAQLVIARQRMSINYGVDRLRFTAPVPVGSRIRLRSTIAEVTERSDGGIQLATDRIFELEGSEKPAMVARTLTLLYGD